MRRFYFILFLELIMLLGFQSISAQSLKPINEVFPPAKIGNTWYVVKETTTYDVTMSDAEDSFSHFCVGTSDVSYSKDSLNIYLSSCEEDSVTMYVMYKKGTSEEVLKGDPQTIILCETPLLTVSWENSIEKNLWAEKEQPNDTLSYETSGEGLYKWSCNFIRKVDNEEPFSTAEQSLEIPLSVEDINVGRTITVTLENVKCLAPDGETDWTPNDAKDAKVYTYHILAQPSCEPEDEKKDTISIFDGKPITLQPIIKGGSENESDWKYVWQTPNNIPVPNPGRELYVESRYLLSPVQTRKENLFNFTAKNHPDGLEEKITETQYVIKTVAVPVWFQELKEVYSVFPEGSCEISFSVKDNDYKNNEGFVSCHLLKDGVVIESLTAEPTSEGIYSYSYKITPVSSSGKENYSIKWQKKLSENDHEWGKYELTKNFVINIVADLSDKDIDFSTSDDLAVLKEGYRIDLGIEGNLPGTWSFVWEHNNSTSARTSYDVTKEDVDNKISAKDFAVKATYKDDTGGSITKQFTFHVVFRNIPSIERKDESKVETCDGHEITINSLKNYVSNTTGWKISEWYDQSSKKWESGNSFTINKNVISGNVTCSYLVKFIYEYNGKEWNTVELPFNFIVYKRPTVNLVSLTGLYKDGSKDIYYGDSDVIKVVPDSNYPDGDWQYDWTKNNSPITNHNDSLIVKTTESKKDTAKSTEKYSVKVRYRVDNSSEYWCDTTCYVEYNIWSKGDLSANSFPQKYIYGDGRSVELKVDTKGGYDKGWKFSWYKNGRLLADNIISENNNTSKIDTITIKVIATNSIGTNYGSTLEKEYKSFVYPKASTQPNFIDGATINRYYNNTDTLMMQTFNGNKDGWKISWKSSTNKTGYQSSFPVTVPTGNDSKIDITVNVSNSSPTGEKWYERVYTYYIQPWSKGEVIKNDKDKIEIGGDIKNAKHTLRPEIKGGYPDGYSFNWEIEGDGDKYVTINPHGNDSCIVTDISPASDIQEVTIKLSWKNEIDDKHKGNSGTITYKFVVKPIFVAPIPQEGWKTDNSESNPERIRDIDNFTLSYSKGRGGSSWKYDWFIHGENVNEAISVNDSIANIKLSIPGEKKESPLCSVELHWYIMDNNGGIVDDGSFFHYVKVYNTPMQPTKLMKKGNGTSNIYVANMSGITDKQLVDYEYSFQFGDGESSVTYAEETTQIWHQYGNKPTSPWVRTCWHYPDFECFSDAVDLNGGTRTITGIEHVEMTELVPRIMVLTLDGNLVKFIEDMDNIQSELFSGMYILKDCMSGESKKIIIR